MLDAEVLGAHVKRMNEDGFTIVEDALEAELVEALREDLDRLERDLGVVPAGNDFEGRSTVRIYNLLAHGKLYERDPDLCCQLNKVDPQAELLERYQGWITGVRRDQADTRARAESLEILEGGILRVQPLAAWARSDVEAYLRAYGIAVHPLFAQGYTSIGCQPCTRPCRDPANERAGRWAGKAKTECGLHTFWKRLA